MPTAVKEKLIRWYFLASVLGKGLDSLLEVLGGLLIIFIPPAAIAAFVINVSLSELAEEPGDFIATHSLQLAQQFATSSGVIIGLYLMLRGLVKLGIVAALLKGWHWAYPVALAVLSLFVVYQAYEITIGHSLLIEIITVLDLIVIVSIAAEYMVVRRHDRVARS